jgi:nucleotide-binding universal stress UspA family protein
VVKKILVPLDGSPLADKVLRYAENLAQKYGAELLLARGLHPMLVTSDYGQKVAFYAPHIFLEEAQARSYLCDLQTELDASNLSTQIAVLEGLPIAEAIVDIAGREGIDMIVMGTRNRSRLSRWIFGSISDDVVQHAPCPVVLVNGAITRHRPDFQPKKSPNGRQSGAQEAAIKGYLSVARQNGNSP